MLTLRRDSRGLPGCCDRAAVWQGNLQGVTEQGVGEWAYIPIEDYGVIGDMHKAVLVAKNGSIEHREALGNFPQAFTHLTLISAAFNLDRALGGTTLA